MSKFVAFLRAINVGGTKVIKMEDLRGMFAQYGYKNAQTYIQSGNVIFEAKDSPSLESKIESQLEKSLGYKVEIFLRSMDELYKIAAKPPFEPKGEQMLHVVFLRAEVSANVKQELLSLQSEADEFLIKGREIYNLRHDRDKSIFSNQFIEKIIKDKTTTRNLNTIRKIVEKYKET